MSVFKFKQFNLVQRESAAKLTTDATIFGAWLPFEDRMKSALEIGTGTGILSLMLAQRSALSILALEIERKAFIESQYNFHHSPWTDQLSVIHEDFNQFQTDEKYDLIFSNPPFFTDNLQSAFNSAKNTAYHTNHLSLQNLASGISKLLSDRGKASIMLPEHEMGKFVYLMQNLGLYVHHSLNIHHNINKPALRVIHEFAKHEISEPKKQKIYIRDEINNFHPEYIKLLQPYLTIF